MKQEGSFFLGSPESETKRGTHKMSKLWSFLGFVAMVGLAVAVLAMGVRSFAPGLGRFFSFTGA